MGQGVLVHNLPNGGPTIRPHARQGKVQQRKKRQSCQRCAWLQQLHSCATCSKNHSYFTGLKLTSTDDDPLLRLNQMTDIEPWNTMCRAYLHQVPSSDNHAQHSAVFLLAELCLVTAVQPAFCTPCLKRSGTGRVVALSVFSACSVAATTLISLAINQRANCDCCSCNMSYTSTHAAAPCYKHVVSALHSCGA